MRDARAAIAAVEASRHPCYTKRRHRVAPGACGLTKSAPLLVVPSHLCGPRRPVHSRPRPTTSVGTASANLHPENNQAPSRCCEDEVGRCDFLPRRRFPADALSKTSRSKRWPPSRTQLISRLIVVAAASV